MMGVSKVKLGGNGGGILHSQKKRSIGMKNCLNIVLSLQQLKNQSVELSTDLNTKLRFSINSTLDLSVKITNLVSDS